MPRNELKDRNFKGLGIHPDLFERLNELGFEHPTPIQYQAIPLANTGQDVIGVAQTGSGKTLAFTMPLLQNLIETGSTGLVLLPTRELAIQVEETIRKIAGASNLRTAILIGGANPHPQIKQLKKKPHIIVATPGRLIDMVEQRHANLSRVGVLVLDEADRMLDMGFAPQLNRILEFMPEKRQTMLFSATMSPEISKIAEKYLHNPKRVEVAKQGTTAAKIDQEFFIVSKSDKPELLKRLLEEYSGSVIVFSRTKHGAKKLASMLRKMRYTADEIHSNRSQNQRQKALTGFASGKYRVLVATDIAARGIDVEDIALVINYDLPDQHEDYVHRIGRTGRAGKSGKAISFATPDQKRDIAQIQRLIKKSVPIYALDGKLLPDIAPSDRSKKTRKERGQRGGRRRFGDHKPRSRRSGKFGKRKSNSSGYQKNDSRGPRKQSRNHKRK